METTAKHTVKHAAAHKEGKVTRAIEHETAKLPSDIFLWTSIACIGASLALKLAGKKHTALFVGQWVAPFLIMGVYDKIVKVQGHDQTDKK